MDSYGTLYTVYSKPNCPHCVSAKVLLETVGANFKVVMLDVGQAKEQGQEYITRDELLALIPGARTMPQIMKLHNGETMAYEVLVGGFTDLKAELTHSE